MAWEMCMVIRYDRLAKSLGTSRTVRIAREKKKKVFGVERKEKKIADRRDP